MDDNLLNQQFNANDLDSYQEFQDLFKQYLEADCWALQIDEEYIFNNYLDDQRTLRENINDQIIRDKIIENPHSNLFVYLHRMHKNCEIKIHMFGDHSLLIRILYDADTKLYEFVL